MALFSLSPERDPLMDPSAEVPEVALLRKPWETGQRPQHPLVVAGISAPQPVEQWGPLEFPEWALGSGAHGRLCRAEKRQADAPAFSLAFLAGLC